MNFETIKADLNGQLFQHIGMKYSNINAGGCGVVAYTLAKELCAVGIDAKIAWLGCSKSEAERNDVFNKLLNTNNELTLHDLNDNGIRCAHCMVLVDGHYIDANGVVKVLTGKWSHYPHTNTITWEQLKAVAENASGWNKMFDRTNIPTIEGLIKKIVNNLN